MMGSEDDVTGPINMGNPHEITVRELAERVLALTGSRSRIVYRPLPQDDPMQRCPDITRARDLLGWTPTIALDNGLARTVAYFEKLLQTGRTGAPALDPEPGLKEATA